MTWTGNVLSLNHAYHIVDGLVFDGQYGPDRAVKVGDVATLIGDADGGGGRISLEEYATAGDALQREALTSLGARLPRVYD